MSQTSRDGTGVKTKTQGLYDRIADVQNIAMKLNGYRESVAKYLRSLRLQINAESLVLDAGCGTGLVSLAFQDAAYHPRRSFALDLSMNSLRVAREEFQARRRRTKKTDPVQGNILQLPFADETFDLVLMCGVLEYTPLDEGLREAARVLKRGAPLVLLYNFKIHPIDNVRVAAARYFSIVGNYEFPVTEPISWSKTIFLLEKR
jgi:ubiquinone/menaquinone biosynthesis C-methylase UbiE